MKNIGSVKFSKVNIILIWFSTMNMWNIPRKEERSFFNIMSLQTKVIDLYCNLLGISLFENFTQIFHGDTLNYRSSFSVIPSNEAASRGMASFIEALIYLYMYIYIYICIYIYIYISYYL